MTTDGQIYLCCEDCGAYINSSEAGAHICCPPPEGPQQPEPIEYYTIQHKWTHESPWLKPDAPLKKRKDKDWSFSSFDHFGASFNPHKGTGNDWRPRWKAADEDKQTLWQRTHCQGWTKLKHAKRALAEVRKDDAEGKYDVRGTYGDRCQAARHAFRIVKCLYTPLAWEPVKETDE